ncbi:hypothetical protein AAC387_Pa01g2067 [Persea americana]
MDGDSWMPSLAMLGEDERSALACSWIRLSLCFGDLNTSVVVEEDTKKVDIYGGTGGGGVQTREQWIVGSGFSEEDDEDDTGNFKFQIPLIGRGV